MPEAIELSREVDEACADLVHQLDRIECGVFHERQAGEPYQWGTPFKPKSKNHFLVLNLARAIIAQVREELKREG